MANNFNPYNNMYMQEMQSMKDRIDRQMQQYQQSQNQLMQQQPPTNLTQNFQLSNANSNNNDFDGKYVDNIDEVKNTLIFKNSLFLNKDMSKMWFKDTGGNIRIFNLQEEIHVDENIVEINNLKQEVGELKALLVQQMQMQTQPVQTENKSQILTKIEPATKVERKVAK